MTLLDGAVVAGSIRESLRTQIAAVCAKGVFSPKLIAVLVGDDSASRIYVQNKIRACQEIGMWSDVMRLPAEISEPALIKHLRDLNADALTSGYIVQLPLPGHIDTSRVVDAIDPAKDVDGFTSLNTGRWFQEQDTFLPATPAGVLELLRYYKIETAGLNAVVVGRSRHVGLPLANLLAQKRSNCTVTICHSQTHDLQSFTRQADLLCVAAGQPELIRGDMVKPGAIVIDVGIHRVEDTTAPKGFRLTGDVCFAEVSQIASAITPVPGGVGPMTVAMLLSNTFKAWRNRHG